MFYPKIHVTFLIIHLFQSIIKLQSTLNRPLRTITYFEQLHNKVKIQYNSSSLCPGTQFFATAQDSCHPNHLTANHQHPNRNRRLTPATQPLLLDPSLNKCCTDKIYLLNNQFLQFDYKLCSVRYKPIRDFTPQTYSSNIFLSLFWT